MQPIQLAFLCFNVCSMFSSHLQLRTVRHFSQVWPKWSSPPFFRTTFWSTFRSVRLQNHTKLCSKRGIQLLLSLHINAICCWKAVFLLNAVFFLGNPWFDFICITCHQTTQRAQTFYILQLFLSLIICTADGYLDVRITLGFPYSLTFHSVIKLRRGCQSCFKVSLPPYPAAQGNLHITQSKLLILIFLSPQTLQDHSDTENNNTKYFQNVKACVWWCDVERIRGL